jgi:uncharacterized protein GlcG (DUF336 family)
MLTLAQASIIVDKALEKGRALACKPLAVAVLDSGGHILALKREEKASILRPQIAEGKAWGVLGMGYGGREMVRRNEIRPSFYLQLAVASGGRMITPAGGVLVLDADKNVIGSVGVTGDTEDHDEACAVAGITAAGLVPDTGDPQQ